MAANYWESTQRKHWQFTKDELAAIRQRLDDEDPTLVQMFPLPPLRHLNIYFNQRAQISSPPTPPFPPPLYIHGSH
jgi:cyclin C